MSMLEKYMFGDPEAGTVFIQPVDGHDLEGIGNEVSLIAANCVRSFHLIAVEVGDWNADLSPWKAPAVFGKEDFGGGAEETLKQILKLCADRTKTYYIGGYSLAGLFALWAAYRTDLFSGVAAASPSVWFPGIADFMKENEIRTGAVYLSLGDREEKTRNPVTSTVGDRIREAYALLSGQGVKCVLEWNEGNHFKDFDVRTAKAFSWVIDQQPARSGNREGEGFNGINKDQA